MLHNTLVDGPTDIVACCTATTVWDYDNVLYCWALFEHLVAMLASAWSRHKWTRFTTCTTCTCIVERCKLRGRHRRHAKIIGAILIKPRSHRPTRSNSTKLFCWVESRRVMRSRLKLNQTGHSRRVLNMFVYFGSFFEVFFSQKWSHRPMQPDCNKDYRWQSWPSFVCVAQWNK